MTDEIKLNLSTRGDADLIKAAGLTNFEEQIAEYKAPLEELGVTEDDLPNLAAETPELSYPLLISDEYPVKMVFKSYKLDFTKTEQWTNIETEVDNIRKQSVRGVEAIQEDPLRLVSGIGLSTLAGAAFGSIKGFGISGAVVGAVTGAAVASGEGKEFLGSVSTIASEGTRMTSYDNYERGELVGTVTLPLQRALQYNDRANYNEGATNFGQGVLSAAGSLISDQNGELQDTTQGLLSSVLARATGAAAGAALGKVAGMAGLGAIAGGLGADPLANFAKEASRVSMNPNLRTLFQGVPIRSFSFPFRMVAKSEKEAIEIKRIVKFFRGEVYPEAINAGTDEEIPFAYKFPNVFDIQIKDKFNKNPAFDIQRCYLNSVTTMFNQTATGMYEGKDNNYFIEVDMTLEFIEVATMDKSKVTGADEKGGF